MEKRKFLGEAVNHVYQRTLSGFNIFYDLEDYLVYYTIFCVLAEKNGVVVYGLCLMIDHRNQVIDYIIVRYSVIRYDLLESCYGGYENMITAINSNAGSEYDINESMYVKSDKEYRELYRYVCEKGFERAGDVITLSNDEKYGLFGQLTRHTSASMVQISKFLHLSVECK